MHKGSCQCRSIQYCFVNEPFDCCYCHCSICRRLTGSAMGSYGSVPKNEFKWTEGEELLSTYQQNETTRRLFCSRCGSYLVTTHSKDKYNVFITLGCLETDIKSKPEFHQFVDSRAGWDTNTYNLKLHTGWPEWRLQRKS